MSEKTEGTLPAAILRGDLAALQKWVQNGGDLNKPIDENSTTALQVACSNGHTRLVEYILKTESLTNLNAVDEAGWTAFLCAASGGHTECCNLLLLAGADPKIPNKQQTTALHYLCRKAVDTPSVNLGASVSHPINLNASMSGTTTTGYDVSNNRGYFELLDVCLRKGIDINHQNSFGETPLMQACGMGNTLAVHWLLSKRAKSRMTNTKNDTALYYAEKGGYSAIVKLLQDKQEQEQKKSLILISM